jgi:inner membrane protein involved in colicin E2 resistance
MRLRPHNPPCKATRAAFGAGAAVMALTRRVDWYALFNGLRKPTHT